MARLSILALVVFALALVVSGPAAQAEEKQEAEKPVSPLASDEVAAAALEKFKEEWKAKGLRGDDKISQRDYAMRALAKVQHPDVVSALGKVSRSGDEILRMIALVYLGDQIRSPHAASKHILAAMKKHKKDEIVLITGLQSIGYLKYLGAREQIKDLLKHKSYIVKKAAIAAVGETLDIRLLGDMMNLIGLKIETESSKQGQKEGGGQTETVEEGYSWEGAEARVDYGDADNTRREIPEARAQAEAQIAANRAAAEAEARARSGNSGGATGSGNPGGRGAQARSPDELIPAILKSLKALTGCDLENPGEIQRWLELNKKAVEHNVKVLDSLERKQKKGT